MDKRLEKRIASIYSQAEKELTEKVDSFFANFERLDKQKRADLAAGKITEEEYKRWRKNKLLRGNDYIALRDNVADRMLDANRIAAAYVNGEMVPAYTKGFNRVGGEAEKALTGYSFTMINEDAVKRLVTNKQTILPYKVVDGKKDVRWNTKKINSAILQGIIQGESSKQMAKRLLESIPEMNKASAIRNARTAFTSAANHGRLDGMKRLQDDGVIVEKEWFASTGDGRTRHAHLELHHATAPIDEPFRNSIGEIMFPGDPEADPSNVYNCRCSIATKILGFVKGNKSEESHKYDGPSYYAPIEIDGFSSNEIELVNKRFKELDEKYHAPVEKVLSTLEREQLQYDAFFKNRIEYEMQQNPKMRRKTAEKKALEMLGPRPEKVSIFLGGDYERKNPVFGMKSTITLNPYSVRVSESITEDIERRKRFDERNAQRLADGRALRTRGNVGDSIESTFIHEYGHAIDAEYNVSSHPDFIDFYENLTSDEIESVSGYAATNKDEFIAEAFCESFMGNTQGDVSKRFMKVLEVILRGKR